MLWPYTLIRFLFLIATALLPHLAIAQSLESAIMPGPVIKGHADQEGNCNQCHVRFDKTAQVRLCLDCHKPVAQDVRARTGYHGRLNNKECRSCHTEHKGRQANIVQLDEKRFDHTQTDFQLKGKHRSTTCASCHKTGTRHAAAPGECNSCHRKEDKHKGNLGTNCQNCHNEERWKDARFDHAKTRFPLIQSHAKPVCADCHQDQTFANTPRDCNGCHRRDDAHKGFFGSKCETCHNEGQWKQSIFRHEKETRFPLLERHRQVKCENCHRTPVYREKTPTRCIACHRNDDQHKGNLGERCEKCHTERGWRSSRFDHDKDSTFPLREKHRTAKCESCHKDPNMREKLPTRCFACHEKDDKEKGHKGRYGEKCDTCHTEKGFKYSIFDHGKDTAFALNGKHRKVKCNDCHKEPLYQKPTDKNCIACHKKDDIHFGTYDLRCDRCHEPADWRKVRKEDSPLVK